MIYCYGSEVQGVSVWKTETAQTRVFTLSSSIPSQLLKHCAGTSASSNAILHVPFKIFCVITWPHILLGFLHVNMARTRLKYVYRTQYDFVYINNFFSKQAKSAFTYTFFRKSRTTLNIRLNKTEQFDRSMKEDLRKLYCIWAPECFDFIKERSFSVGVIEKEFASWTATSNMTTKCSFVRLCVLLSNLILTLVTNLQHKKRWRALHLPGVRIVYSFYI